MSNLMVMMKAPNHIGANMSLVVPPVIATLEKVGSYASMERSSQPTNGSCEISHSYGIGIVGGQDKNNVGYAQSSYISGWMYVNESGQMCGPYMQQQLCEGLSTGFLPEALPVYPVVNGNVINPVPLTHLKHSLDQANWGPSSSLMVPIESCQLACHLSESGGQGESIHYSSAYSEKQPEPQLCNADTAHGSALQKIPEEIIKCSPSGLPKLQSSEESCWMFEDEELRKHGPHSLAELYYWHHSSYLHDLLMTQLLSAYAFRTGYFGVWSPRLIWSWSQVALVLTVVVFPLCHVAGE